MAEEARNENDDAAPEEGGAERSRSLLFVILVALLAMGGGVAATYFLLRAPAAEEELAAAGKEEAGEVGEGAAGAEEEIEAPATPYYFSLDPPFVVNFVGKGRSRFLQVNIDGLTRNPSVKEDITTHLPQIRNNVVFLLSSQRREDLESPEGKETLRKQVLEEIRSILKQETGNAEVEDIYFTSFVIQ